MPPEAPDPAALTALLVRARAGDPAARDDLLRAALGRLEALTRRMLRRQPAVRRWAESGDVLSGAAVRLLRALESTPVADTRGFLALATVVIRRELVDLARHFYGPEGVGANHASHPPAGDAAPPPDPDAAELDRWAALHRAAEALPAAEREVFGLTFYHGWTQPQIAELFGVDERTVRRRWKAACAALRDALGADLPGG